jgi:hypothetical protein
MSFKLAAQSTLAAAAIFGLSLTATAPASTSEVGLLTCRSPQTIGYVLCSSTTYDCVFQSSVGGSTQHYTATINRAGAEIGWSGNTTLVWAVFAASTKAWGKARMAARRPEPPVGLGARANALFGGLPNCFALQPVSVEGETGLNVRPTVTGLWLNSAVRHHARKSRKHRK